MSSQPDESPRSDEAAHADLASRDRRSRIANLLLFLESLFERAPGYFVATAFVMAGGAAIGFAIGNLGGQFARGVVFGAIGLVIGLIVGPVLWFLFKFTLEYLLDW